MTRHYLILFSLRYTNKGSPKNYILELHVTALEPLLPSGKTIPSHQFLRTPQRITLLMIDY